MHGCRNPETKKLIESVGPGHAVPQTVARPGESMDVDVHRGEQAQWCEPPSSIVSLALDAAGRTIVALLEYSQELAGLTQALDDVDGWPMGRRPGGK